MSNPPWSLQSREAVFSAMILQCYLCMGASAELCSCLTVPVSCGKHNHRILAQNFHVTFSIHPIQKKKIQKKPYFEFWAMYIEFSVQYDFTHIYRRISCKTTVWSICSMKCQFCTNCTILQTATSDHFLTARGSMKVSRPMWFVGSFVQDQACVKKK